MSSSVSAQSLVQAPVVIATQAFGDIKVGGLTIEGIFLILGSMDHIDLKGLPDEITAFTFLPPDFNARMSAAIEAKDVALQAQIRIEANNAISGDQRDLIAERASERVRTFLRWAQTSKPVVAALMQAFIVDGEKIQTTKLTLIEGVKVISAAMSQINEEELSQALAGFFTHAIALRGLIAKVSQSWKS
jgi:hypothetical protein